MGEGQTTFEQHEVLPCTLELSLLLLEHPVWFDDKRS